MIANVITVIITTTAADDFLLAPAPLLDTAMTVTEAAASPVSRVPAQVPV